VESRVSFCVALCAALSALSLAPAAIAQPKKPKPPADQPAPPPGMPPTTGTDLELDPDAPKEPPAEEKPPEPPPLPPADPDAWGVGGKEEEGKFAPQGKTGSLKEEEEAKKEAEDDKGPVDLGLPGALYIDTVIGFGEINNSVSDASIPTDVTIFSFVFGVQYRVFDIWTLGLRFPYSTGSIKGPLPDNSDDFNTFAVGNLEFSVSPSFQLTRRWRIAPGVAFALPSASGDLFALPEDRGAIAQALVNQAAASSRGWEENALFASKRFGLTPSVAATYDKDALHLAARMKLDGIFRTGGNDPNPMIAEQANIVLHDPNTTFMLQAQGSYDFLDGRVSPGLRMWLSVFQEPVSSETATGSRDFSGAQFVLEPTVTGKFPITASGGLAIRGAISYVLPIAGPLGDGDNGATIGGLRLKVGLLF
jgi:hypothetical protein